MEELNQDKACIEAAIGKDLKAVAQGDTDGAETVALCQRYNLDESLCQALPGTCSRTPAERGPFDKMVLDQLETCLKQKLAEISTAIEAEIPAAKERVSAVSEATEIVKNAEAAQATAEEQESSAKASCQEAASGVESAKTLVAAQEPMVSDAIALREEKA